MSITGSFGTLSIGGEKVADVSSWELETDRCERLERKTFGGAINVTYEFGFDCSNPFKTTDVFEPGTVCCLAISHEVAEWQFPHDRFITYEPSDEPWCRALGIGREIIVRRECRVNDAVLKRLDDGRLGFEGIAASISDSFRGCKIVA